MCHEIIRESLQHKVKNVAGFTEFLLDEVLSLRNLEKLSTVQEITKRLTDFVDLVDEKQGMILEVRNVFSELK